MASNAELTGLLVLLSDGEMGQAEWERLEALLLDDPAAQEFYRRWIGLDVDLAWRAAGRTARLPFEAGDAEAAAVGAAVTAGAAVELPQQLDESPVPSPESPVPQLECIIPPIIIDTDLSPGSGFPSSLGGWLFSYAAATVITGLAILGAWAYKVSHDDELAKYVAPPSPSVEKGIGRERPFVGRITGMADCRWAGPAPQGTAVSLGRKYALAAGLIEIAYDSGAKVILQGPCTYEVESAAGGFLSQGKLTARVEKSEIRNPKSEGSNPQSLIPGPLFAVRTPTATVTDLGTEFGVEVSKEGTTTSHVFRGTVNVRVAGENGGQEEVVLRENESARVEKGKGAGHLRLVWQGAAPDAPARFVRDLKHFLRSQVISVNFTDRGKSDLEPTEQTGVVRVGWWNNVDGNPLPPPTVPLHDAAGSDTGAKLAWQWLYHAAALPYRTCDSYRESPARYPFEKLLDGRFNGVVDLTHRTPVSLTIIVRGVPYKRYRVYVYYSTRPASNESANSEMHTFGLSVNGSKPLIVGRPQYWLNDFYRYKSASWSGNYQVFDGLSGDLTVAATPDGPGPFHDKFIAGFQIVEMSQ